MLLFSGFNTTPISLSPEHYSEDLYCFSMSPDDQKDNYDTLTPPPNPPRRRRTANMNPVLCVP